MVITRKSKISATCPNTAMYICKMRETEKSLPNETKQTNSLRPPHFLFGNANLER